MITTALVALGVAFVAIAVLGTVAAVLSIALHGEN